jgi:hypothetical protein
VTGLVFVSAKNSSILVMIFFILVYFLYISITSIVVPA